MSRNMFSRISTGHKKGLKHQRLRPSHGWYLVGLEPKHKNIAETRSRNFIPRFFAYAHVPSSFSLAGDFSPPARPAIESPAKPINLGLYPGGVYGCNPSSFFPSGIPWMPSRKKISDEPCTGAASSKQPIYLTNVIFLIVEKLPASNR